MTEFGKSVHSWDLHNNTCKDCCNAYERSVRGLRAKYQREWKLLKKYGMSLEDYNTLLEKQHGVCAICGAAPLDGELRGELKVDHNHSTGEVRGLLCDNCNKALGLFKDNPKAMRRAAAYVEGGSLE